MAPAEMGRYITAQHNPDGTPQRKGGSPETDDHGPHFLGKDGRNQGRSAWGVSGFADTDCCSGNEKLTEIIGEGAGHCRYAPKQGHDADALLSAPSVNDYGNGKR